MTAPSQDASPWPLQRSLCALSQPSSVNLIQIDQLSSSTKIEQSGIKQSDISTVCHVKTRVLNQSRRASSENTTQNGQTTRQLVLIHPDLSSENFSSNSDRFLFSISRLKRRMHWLCTPRLLLERQMVGYELPVIYFVLESQNCTLYCSWNALACRTSGSCCPVKT